MFEVIIAITCLMVSLWLTRRRFRKFHEIPGPGIMDTVHDIFRVSDPNTYHMTITKMAKRYGPVMHITQIHEDLVIVSGYEGLHELLIEKGREFGGRPAPLSAGCINRHLGILGAWDTTERWNALRKLSQFHLKQYSEGMTLLGKRVTEITEDMLESWGKTQGQPVDPEMTIFQTVVRSVLFLTMSIKPTEEDPLISKFQDYFDQAVVVYSFDQPWVIRFINMFPWLKYFNAKPWRLIKKFIKTEDDIWEEMKERSYQNINTPSLVSILMNKDAEVHKRVLEHTEVDLPESEARAAALGIIIAGIGTIKDAFYATVNILAHYRDVRSEIHKEMQNAIGHSIRDVNLDDHSKMPYTRATVYEILRYMTVVPASVPHRCTQDSTLLGHPIMEGTILRANLWGLHHDPELWSDPFEFQPERFLDAEGNLVSADHPSRKHLMAFGVGTRACLGETLALARLFLLISRMIQRFEVLPAEGNTKDITDCRKFLNYGTTMHSANYKVVFKERNN